MRTTFASVFALAVSALALPTPGDNAKRDGVQIVEQTENVYLGVQASVSYEGSLAPYNIQVISGETQEIFIEEWTDNSVFEWTVENIDQGTQLQYVISDNQGYSVTSEPFVVKASPHGPTAATGESLEILEQTENVYLGSQAAISWTGGKPSYSVQVIDGETQEVYFVEYVDESAFEWTVLNIDQGTQLQVFVTDSEGASVTSTPFVVRPSPHGPGDERRSIKL